MPVTVTTRSIGTIGTDQVAAGAGFEIDENSNLIVVDDQDNRVAGYARGAWQSVQVS